MEQPTIKMDITHALLLSYLAELTNKLGALRSELKTKLQKRHLKEVNPLFAPIYLTPNVMALDEVEAYVDMLRELLKIELPKNAQ